uniref:Carbonic anhydrase n=1 Tax=Ciona savignyi TaxID=51511 RepID=H2Z003_CIOSA
HTTNYTLPGPSNWSAAFPICNLTRQSPINVIKSNVQTASNPVKFQKSVLTTPSSMTLINNGHSRMYDVIVLYFKDHRKHLKESFPQAMQFHFHWGSSFGSEHTVDSTRYFGEMHIVHYDTAHADINAAINKPQGLAVIAFFIKVNNAAFQKILQPISAGMNKNAQKTLTPFPISDLLPKITGYYRYSGSLTTPPCYESVVWTIFKDPIQISAAQVNVFATILKTKVYENTAPTPVINNYRPVQGLNGRTVREYKL